jgi:cytoskeletal protein RodZ
MKQCPQCGSIYSDDTLNYCLTDRASLVPASMGQDTPTVVREYPVAPQTQVINSASGVSPVFKYVAVGLVVLLLMLAGAGLAAWMFWNSRTEQTQVPNASPTPAAGTTPSRTPSANAVVKSDNKAEPSPTKAPAASPTVPVKDIPENDPGTGRITFRKGSVSQTVSGTAVHSRSFVLRTMAGQSLRATVTSARGCVEFDAGGSSVEFTTPSGDVSLDLRNTCGEPVAFSMTVTVR